MTQRYSLQRETIRATLAAAAMDFQVTFQTCPLVNGNVQDGEISKWISTIKSGGGSGSNQIRSRSNDNQWSRLPIIRLRRGCYLS